MSKRKKPKPADISKELPLTGREPFHPPARNLPFLLTTVILLFGWLVFLIWLAVQSN